MCGFSGPPRYSCTRLQFGFSYLPWHTSFFVLVLEHARPVISPADILQLHSCLLQQEGSRRQQLLLAATPARYDVPVHRPLVCTPDPWHLISSSRVPLLFFHIPFQLEEPTLDVLHQVHWGEEEDYFPSAGKDLMKGFGHAKQVKLGKLFPLASLGKSDPCMCILWGRLTRPKEPDAPYQPFAVRCRTDITFSLGKAEGFRDQFYCQLVQEEAKEAGWDLGRSDRLPVWWWFRKREAEHHHRASPRPLPAHPRPAGEASSSCCKKETFGPIKWQLSKLQENAAQLRVL